MRTSSCQTASADPSRSYAENEALSRFRHLACFKVQFTVGRDTYDKLRHVQDLLRHSIPNGDPAAIFDRAYANA